MRRHRRGLTAVGPAVPDAGAVAAVRHSRTYTTALRRHRRGLSLTEVLVAMFVMALGLMALLTLFPLGAMQIGQALKDDRTAQTVSQADTWVRVWWRAAVQPYASDPNAPPADPALNALDDPNLTNRVLFTNSNGPVYDNVYAGTAYMMPTPATYLQPATAPSNTRLNPLDLTGDTNEPPTGGPPLPPQSDTATQQFRYARRQGQVKTAGYPVLIDPLGSTSTRSGLGLFDRFWVGRNNGNVYGATAGTLPILLPRRNTAATPTGTQAYTASALTDDLTFQTNGAAGTGTDPLARQGRYHWAALLQRPDNSKPDQANLTVLVFDGRPPFLGIAGDEVALMNGFVNPLDIPGVVPAGARSMSLDVPTRGSDQPPLVRRGGWVMVASMQPGASGVRAVGFHRITGLAEVDPPTTNPPAPIPPGATRFSLDIDPPIKSEFSPNGIPLPAGEVRVYLLAGLSEVFERPLLTR